MPHLWIEQDSEWCVFPLSRDELPLAVIPTGPAPPGVLFRSRSATKEDWHLLANQETGITLNGLGLLGDFRALADRDEIRIPGTGSVFFSTERLAAVEALPASAGDLCCPRCRQAVLPDTPAVCCPSCGVWHHGSEALPCWTYAPGCAMCGQATAMDAGYQWTPEDL
jgi:hypothetical protein